MRQHAMGDLAEQSQTEKAQRFRHKDTEGPEAERGDFGGTKPNGTTQRATPM